MTHPTPFQMSIESTHGKSERNGFHLGTDERIARELVVERFHGRLKFDMPTVTIALLDAKGKIVDVYDGEWSSESYL